MLVSVSTRDWATFAQRDSLVVKLLLCNHSSPYNGRMLHCRFIVSIGPSISIPSMPCSDRWDVTGTWTASSSTSSANMASPKRMTTPNTTATAFGVLAQTHIILTQYVIRTVEIRSRDWFIILLFQVYLTLITVHGRYSFVPITFSCPREWVRMVDDETGSYWSKLAPDMSIPHLTAYLLETWIHV